jgi:hypothetical protein
LDAETVPLYEIEHDIGCRACEAPQPLAVVRAEQSLYLVGIILEARDHLSAVPARRAEARTMSVDSDHVDTALGEMQGG